MKRSANLSKPTQGRYSFHGRVERSAAARIAHVYRQAVDPDYYSNIPQGRSPLADLAAANYYLHPSSMPAIRRTSIKQTHL